MPDITAAPADLRLVRKDKTLTLRMRPLTDRDITELDRWLKSQVIRIAQDSIDENTSRLVAEMTLQVALSKSLDMSFVSYDGRTMLGGMDGMTRIVWQSTRKDHPAITEQEIKEYFLDAESVVEFNRVFSLLNAQDDSAQDKSGSADSSEGTTSAKE